ncbi:MAG: tetratricopeptide repeat protein [Candidatus Zixiibacteriota bacterium]
MISCKALIAAVAISVLFLAAGCSQSNLSQGERALNDRNYQLAIDHLEKALKEKPTDAKVMSTLGRAYYHKGDIENAEKLLVQAQKGLPSDGTTALYLGMVAENKMDFASAEKQYRGYLARDGKSKSAEAIKGRLLYVQNENLRRQAAEAVKQEAAISKESPAANTVGVLPFVVGEKSDETTRSLATGLQTVTWYDLASVPEIQVVERLEFKYLISELELAERGFSEEKSAPRLGKLVRAGKLVNTSVDKPSETSFSMSSALVNTGDAAYTPTYGKDSKLKDAMKMQKDMVLSVLDSLGVEVEGSRRQALKKIPTENYDAFLAFSQGVELYDNGEYIKAKSLFERAIGLDPQFDLARGFSANATLIAENSGSLSSFDVKVLAINVNEPGTQFDPINNVINITDPIVVDPRQQDQPQDNSTGTATVSGTIR